MKNRQKVFDKISLLIDAMNREVLGYLGIKFEKREAYSVDYVSELLTMYKETTGLDETSFVSGRGHRKSIRQKQYEELHEYLERLKSYAYHIETCGEERNSYSKTDHGATFMRLKRDYMGNDQLLPAYNLQVAICDEYRLGLFVPFANNDRNLWLDDTRLFACNLAECIPEELGVVKTVNTILKNNSPVRRI